MAPRTTRALRHAAVPVAIAAGFLLQIAASADGAVDVREALASVAPRALDRALHPRCMKALRAGDPVAFCGGRGRVSIRARGFRARSGAHAASLRGSHALKPGTKVAVRGDLGSRKAQLALVYRVGDRHVYVRFSRFVGHPRSAVVTSRRHGSKVTVRLHVSGRTIAPARQRGYARATTTTSAPPVSTPPARPLATPGDATGPETTSGAPCGPAPTSIPRSDDALNSLWTVCGPGWTGGDGAYSARLPDGREVWAFGDTFLGRVNPDGSRPADSPMARNSLVVQDGTRLTTLRGGTSAQPASLVSPADPASWYWSGTPVVEGSKLYWFLSRWRATGGGSWDFSYQDTAVATFSLPDLRLESVTTVPGSSSVLWGAAVLDDGAYTYVYGTENSGGHRYAHVARAPRGLVTGGWEYFTGSGWS